MKRLVTCAALLALVCALSIGGVWHMRSMKACLDERLDEASRLYTDGKSAEAADCIRGAIEKWQQNEYLMNLYLDREKTITIGASLSRILGLVEMDVPEVIAECHAVKKQLDAIYATQLPLLQNIF